MITRKFRFAPEGINIIAGSGLLLAVILILSALTGRRWLRWMTLLGSGWMLAVLQFFRDPQRITRVDHSRQITAPADGKIIVLDADAADTPLPQPTLKVSIFMSPLDVHVNRSPFSGRVKSVEHYAGRFLSAFKPQASWENERVVVTMETDYGITAFQLVAGFLARRIVFHPQPGDHLQIGERMGMIKFGSRVDLFLPADATLRVNIGDLVTAGETIIGEFNEK